MLRNKKGSIKIILILIVILATSITASVIVYMNINKSNSDSASKSKDKSITKSNTTSENWGLTINETPISLPCTLEELSKANIHVNDSFYDELISSTNKTFTDVYATSEGWKDGLTLDLEAGSDSSQKEKNITVSSIDFNIPSHKIVRNKKIVESNIPTTSQFHIRSNITIGSTSKEVVEAFGSEYIQPERDLYLDGLDLVFYKSGNSTLCIGWTNGIVHKIKIYID